MTSSNRRSSSGRRAGPDNHGRGWFGKVAGLWAGLALAFGLVSIGGIAPALALPNAPSLKPPRTFASKWLVAPEFNDLARALDAADAGRWSDVRASMNRISDPTAKQLLQWRLATDGGSAMGFTELTRAMSDLKDWPDMNRVQAQAEITISISGLSPADRVAWLRAAGPSTGDGMYNLADALRANAQPLEATPIAREAWRTRLLTDDTERRLRANYGSELTEADHWARVDMLLWRGDISGAKSLMPLLNSDHTKLANARIALTQNKKGIDALVNAIPGYLENDPGLLLERARWRERRGQDDGELEMLLRIKSADAPPVGREEIWSERASVIRRLIRERAYTVAYGLAADHGLTTGESFRDAEWLAGWLALVKLNDPVKAEKHFRTFGDGVATPISLSRAGYWLGEALTAQGRTVDAQIAYVSAAKYLYVFYGQLAAEKLTAVNPDARTLDLPPLAPLADPDRTAFMAKPPVRAAAMLADTGRLASFEKFSNFLDDRLETPADHQMLFDLAAGYMEMRAAVRGGKGGLQRNLIAPDAVFPILQLPASPRTGSAEPAMVLALSRQESEFNPRAVSTADARGLMQMIPTYARAEAIKVGLPYRASWLTDDPTYNLRLGRGFLDDLVDTFDGSYILAAAAYNAGPSRVRQWLRDFGDPRSGMDPVEWIESIPFSETRNYVQRVLENTQVYRARLSGKPTQVRLMDDLKRGRP